jgi:hypothetical protein
LWEIGPGRAGEKELRWNLRRPVSAEAAKILDELATHTDGSERA